MKIMGRCTVPRLMDKMSFVIQLVAKLAGGHAGELGENATLARGLVSLTISEKQLTEVEGSHVEIEDSLVSTKAVVVKHHC